ncbi:uncharacterized protein LOC135201443 [Macrobrachium nipponense]|uniref:uncharacterized protein LOC135201443 n=1 Tax=Macrobrachium nipponense TaxID=159736 RepID=UPI0030C7EA6F
MDKSGLDTFVLSEKDKEDFRALMEDVFIPYEPMCVGCKGTAKELLPFILGFGAKGLASGVSFGMKEKSSGRVIAAVSNYFITPEDTAITEDIRYDEEKSNWYSDVMAEFCAGVDVFKGKFKKCLDITSLCVHPDYKGKGLAKELIRLSEEKGREMGCDVASIQASNIVTYHISKKLGFEEIHRQEVETLKDENGLPVLDMEFMKTNGTTFLSFLTKAL